MKTYSTAQAIRLLELHPDWEFEAPRCAGRQKQRLTSAAQCFYVERELCGAWENEPMPDYRNDWVRVDQKRKKRERVNVGELNGAAILGLGPMLGTGGLPNVEPDARYKIVAVKK